MDTKSLLIGIISFMMGGLVVSTAAVTIEKPKDSMASMVGELKDKTGDEFDKAFINAMINHHEGAIEMAKLSEESALHSEIKVLSESIIEEQESEVGLLRHWQGVWGYPASEASGH